MRRGNDIPPPDGELLPHELPDATEPEGSRQGQRRTTGRGRWETSIAILLLASLPLSCVCMPYGPGTSAAAILLGAVLYLTSPHTTPATRRVYLALTAVAWALIACVYIWGALTGFTWTVPWTTAAPPAAP